MTPRTVADPDAVSDHLALGRALEEDARTIPTAPRSQDFVLDFLQNALEFRMVYRAWVGDADDEANAKLIPTYRAMYPGVAYEPVPFAEELGLSFSSPWEHPDPKYVDNEFIKAVYAELPQIPTPQVWGSLMTEISRDRHRTGGKGTANDVYDVFRAAIAIPVVRLYGTDGGMKGLLDRSRIADEFGVEVYSARRDDPENFICAVRALPSGCSA